MSDRSFPANARAVFEFAVGTPVITLDLFKNTPSDFSLANWQVAWDTWTKGPSKNCANNASKTAERPPMPLSPSAPRLSGRVYQSM